VGRRGSDGWAGGAPEVTLQLLKAQWWRAGWAQVTRRARLKLGGRNVRR